MADEEVISNGVESHNEEDTDLTISKSNDVDLIEKKDSEISELRKEKFRLACENEAKIRDLTEAKTGLESENEANKERIKSLNDEIEVLKKNQDEMQRKIDQWEEDKKALRAISERAAELETEIAQMQHYLGENEVREVEIQQLRSQFDELKRTDREKGSKIEDLEKEKVSLLARIDQEVEEVKKSKLESEIRSRDLEARDVKFSEKENELLELQKVKKKAETEKSTLEFALAQSEKKLTEVEAKVSQLKIELEDSNKMVAELEKKNEELNNAQEGLKSVETRGNQLSQVQWPVALASTGTLAAAATAAICYVTLANRK